MHGLYVTRRSRVVTQCLAQAGYRLTQGGLGNNRITPDSVHEFLAGDQTITVRDQINEEPQYLWLEMDFLRAPEQRPGHRIDPEEIKSVFRVPADERSLCVCVGGPSKCKLHE